MPAIRIERRHQKLDLERLPTAAPKQITRDQVAAARVKLDAELFELQELMWGARTHSVLVVLQGRDAAGKDGTIKEVVGALNPRGVRVVSFGVPSQEEQQHDFLWRVHQHAPRFGEVAIFNRSHYEDVLVARVHRLVAPSVWRQRYEHIRAFEALLSDSGCILLKVFLHISKREQKERLLEREHDVSKAWKIDPTDWAERARWSQYTRAYEDALSQCASRSAPWLVVPGDHKWYRNLCVSQALVAALRPYRSGWLRTLKEKGAAGRRALEAYKKAAPRTRAQNQPASS
jgi:PPK2 family polyphosphate:nucleotide phosphotransferase